MNLLELGFEKLEGVGSWKKLIDGPISLILYPLEGKTDRYGVVVEQAYFGDGSMTIREASKIQTEYAQQGKILEDHAFLLNYNAVQMCIINSEEQLNNIITVLKYGTEESLYHSGVVD